MESINVTTHLPYVWDYDLTEEDFRAILSGQATKGRLDRDWAAIRLLEYAPYEEIIRLLGFRAIVEGWPQWRECIRAESRKRGFDFLIDWLPKHHPELLSEGLVKFGGFPFDYAKM